MKYQCNYRWPLGTLKVILITKKYISYITYDELTDKQQIIDTAVLFICRNHTEGLSKVTGSHVR